MVLIAFEQCLTTTVLVVSSIKDSPRVSLHLLMVSILAEAWIVTPDKETPHNSMLR